MVWQHFYKELVRLKDEGVTFDLSDGILIHGGGWKKLISEAYKGEKLGIKEARKHFTWYLHSLRGAAAFRREAVRINTLSDLDRLIEQVLSENPEQ